MRLSWALVCVALLLTGDGAEPTRAWPEAPPDLQGAHYIEPGRGAHVPLNSSTYRAVYDLFDAFEAHGVLAALFFGDISRRPPSLRVSADAASVRRRAASSLVLVLF